MDRPEGEAERARSLRTHLHEHYGLKAPSLLVWEVGQVVHRKFPRRFATTAPKRVALVATLLRDFELSQPTAASVRETGVLAEKYGLSFYDAAYLELASRDDVSVLVTEDVALGRSARGLLGEGRAYTARAASEAVDDGEL